MPANPPGEPSPVVTRFRARLKGFRSLTEARAWATSSGVAMGIEAMKGDASDWSINYRAYCGADRSCPGLLGVIHLARTYCPEEECNGFAAWHLWMDPKFGSADDGRRDTDQSAKKPDIPTFKIIKRLRNGVPVGSHPYLPDSHPLVPAVPWETPDRYDRQPDRQLIGSRGLLVQCPWAPEQHGFSLILPPPEKEPLNPHLWVHRCQK